MKEWGVIFMDLWEEEEEDMEVKDNNLSMTLPINLNLVVKAVV